MITKLHTEILDLKDKIDELTGELREGKRIAFTNAGV
jgi:cell division septum initiation protein DivIVA